MDNSNKNKAAEEQDENQQQQLLQRQSSTNMNMKAPEERPYRRRIKPPPAKVHHVHPARFRRFVQRRTCCYCLMPPEPNNVTTLPASDPEDDDDGDATSTSTSATNSLLAQPPADAAAATDGGRDPATSHAAAGCFVGATRESMQEAYVAWCSSNDLPLSPGTMAELPFTDRHPFSNGQRSSKSERDGEVSRRRRRWLCPRPLRVPRASCWPSALGTTSANSASTGIKQASQRNQASKLEESIKQATTGRRWRGSSRAPTRELLLAAPPLASPPVQAVAARARPRPARAPRQPCTLPGYGLASRRAAAGHAASLHPAPAAPSPCAPLAGIAG
ncbi:hypothetical protein PVAP13_9KG238313 [Panicum virgatum]|uniref:Uncharacterized protein n=1 Tax=Panicum virgatum TaxID=38727 RepID=A0A8T0NJI0_PANVG|nr:hypothetical protein PVAP13_9KG238313 [Panicum virgatum]